MLYLQKFTCLIRSKQHALIKKERRHKESGNAFLLEYFLL